MLPVCLTCMQQAAQVCAILSHGQGASAGKVLLFSHLTDEETEGTERLGNLLIITQEVGEPEFLPRQLDFLTSVFMN